MDWSAIMIESAAGNPPVSTDDMKSHLRVSHSDDDAAIAAAVLAATAFLERRTGVALVTQTWRYTRDAFADPMVLPGWPIKSVTSVNYYDLDNASQVVDAADYRVALGREPVRIEPVSSWPGTKARAGAVWVDYVVGEAVADVDPQLLAAVKLQAAHLYEHREAVGEAMAVLPLGVVETIDDFRRFHVAA